MSRSSYSSDFHKKELFDQMIKEQILLRESVLFLFFNGGLSLARLAGEHEGDLCQRADRGGGDDQCAVDGN